MVMINSMTGYGGADGQLNGLNYTVEIKTVNSRYFKTKIKLPDSVSFLEENIEKLLRQNLSRGMVTYSLEFKKSASEVLFDINETALKATMEKLKQIAGDAEMSSPIDIAYLLTLPGMVCPAAPDKTKAEQIKKEIIDSTQKAIDELKQMRATEGDALAVVLDSYCKIITEDLDQICTRKDTVLVDYRKKLQKRIDNLLANAKLKLDEETLVRELAIFADRSDITEEIARLHSHLEQFTQSCHKQGQAGRRLDFIAQEMLREANTIASKASDTDIIRCVVDMKCQIDRIKEQVQNIE